MFFLKKFDVHSYQKSIIRITENLQSVVLEYV